MILLGNFKKKYINSAFLLLLSSVVVKAASALYKIPLTALVGGVGRGCFTIAYNYYMPFHAVIMGALPVAVTHLVSKYNEQGNREKMQAVKKAAGRLFFAVGLVGLLAMLIFAKPYAVYISSSPKSLYTMYILAPTIFFSALAASHRAFAEGFMNMLPTSVSQMIEAAFKMLFGLLFAKLALGKLYGAYLESGTVFGMVCAGDEEALSVIYPITAAAAIGGATIGAVISWVYVSLYANLKYGRGKRLPGGCRAEAGEIISFSLPIIASTLIQSLFTFLDNSTVQYCLSLCDTGQLYEIYEEALSISGTAREDMITYVYGLFSAVGDFKNLVPGITMAIGVAAVPAVTGAYEAGNKESLTSLSNSIFKYCAILGFGGSAYLAVISPCLLNLLYGSSNYDIVVSCSALAAAMSLTVFLYCLSGTVIFAVQAINRAKSTVFIFMLSGVIRIVLNFLFVSKAQFNLYGAVISGAAGYGFILLAGLYVYKKYSGVKYNVRQVFIKPAVCAALAAAAAKLTSDGIAAAEHRLLCFVLFSGVFAIAFVILLILSKSIETNELKFLQYCKKSV